MAHLVFEHLQTGGIRPFAIFRTVRLLPYDGDAGELQLALDGLIITCVLLLLFLRIRGLLIAMRNDSRGPSPVGGHLTRLWVWLDWVFILLFWVVLATKYYVRAAMQDLHSRQGAGHNQTLKGHTAPTPARKSVRRSPTM